MNLRATEFTVSEINRLGERLRKAQTRPDDLRMLARFRDGFEPATVRVAEIVQSLLFCKATMALRPSKSTLSIIAKLEREKSRLSQMQDIGGLRVIVAKMSQQRRLVSAIDEAFSESRSVNRIVDPRSGYRGIHVIVKHAGRLVEIQVRTRLQNLWAQISEKLADSYGQEVKYGGGPQPVQQLLRAQSDWIRDIESFEVSLDEYKSAFINGLLRKNRRGGRHDADERRLLKAYQERQAMKRRQRVAGFKSMEEFMRRLDRE